MREENRNTETVVNTSDFNALAAHKKEERDYWVRQLAGEWQKAAFPYDERGHTESTGQTAQEEIPLSPSAGTALLKLGNNSDSLILMLTAALTGMLLQRYCGQDDVLLGLPVYRQETAEKIINTAIPCRLTFTADSTFKTILKELRNTVKEGMKHYAFPMNVLAETLGLEAGMGSSPFFDVAVVLENIQDKDYLSRHKPNMTFVFRKTNQGLSGAIHYNPALWKGETIRDIALHFNRLAEGAVGHPDQKNNGLNIVDDTEQTILLSEFNAPAQLPPQSTIHEAFGEIALQYPESVALVYHHTRFTYRQVDAVSDNLANWLRSHGVQAGSIVAVLLPRKPEMVIALLAILKAGAVYLPIDPGYPSERIHYMLKDSSAAMLLSQQSQLETLNLPPDGYGTEIKDIDSALEGLDKEEAATVEPHALPEHSPAYVIYTSGSTGRPKGVLVGHQGVVALVRDTNFIQLKKDSKLLLTGALGFDITTFEIWAPLLNGLELHLASDNEILDTGKLADIVINSGIDILHLIPQLYYQMAAQRMDAFEGLEYFLVGGDMVKSDHVNKLVSAWPHVKILHMYGPTENTTFSTYLPVDRPYDGRLPIGKPLTNSTVHLLDKDSRLLQIGALGEICTGGCGVANGYLNRPELTHDTFANDPFAEGGKLYKTGDLGRWQRDGTLDFWGRKDKQIKIRGFRVEISEIESKLLDFDGITEAVIIAADGGDDGDTRLCAYFVGNPGLNTQQIRDFMTTELPSYMVPSFFIPIPRMPLTPNGKLDTRALPSPALMGGDAEYVPPETELECALADIWKEVLGIQRVGVLDNFFTIGGNSLKAIQLGAKIQEVLGREVPVFVLFERYTIRSFIAHLEMEDRQTHEEEIEQLTEESMDKGISARAKQRQLRRMEEDDEQS
jgi:amino acid adenylation domain-containing protein